MKNIFLQFVFTIISNVLFAQTSNTKVIYTFKHLDESKKLELIYDDTSSLSVFDKIGFDTTFSSYKGALYDSDKGLAVKVPTYDSIGQQVYRNFPNKEIILRQTKVGVLDAFEVTDKWIDIKWKISNKKKNILGYQCQKATGIYRGRTYTAWYALEINKPYGPWKFFGLPGLILEVYDEENKFSFKAISLNVSQDAIIMRPNENEKKSLEEYVYYLNNKPDIIHKKIKSKKMPEGIIIGDISYQTPITELRLNRMEKQFEMEEPILESTIIPKGTFSTIPKK